MDHRVLWISGIEDPSELCILGILITVNLKNLLGSRDLSYSIFDSFRIEGIVGSLNLLGSLDLKETILVVLEIFGSTS